MITLLACNYCIKIVAIIRTECVLKEIFVFLALGGGAKSTLGIRNFGLGKTKIRKRG